MELRVVKYEDCKLLWEWRNDPDVCIASFTAGPVPWKEHVAWFTKKMVNYHCYLFIAMDYVPVGQIRFDVEEDLVELTVSVDKALRHNGLGSDIVNLGVERILPSLGAIHAHVKPNNKQSQAIFKKAGFENLGSVIFKQQDSILFRKDRKWN